MGGESRFNLTGGLPVLYDYEASSHQVNEFASQKVISVSKFRLSYSFRWLLFATATVEI